MQQVGRVPGMYDALLQSVYTHAHTHAHMHSHMHTHTRETFCRLLIETSMERARISICEKQLF